MRTTKICSRCRTPKPLIEFYPHPGTRDAYDGWCKACHCTRALSAYHRKHPHSRRDVRTQPAQHYVFKCGCSGILPARTNSNKFATSCAEKTRLSTFKCRVTSILTSSALSAKRDGGLPIPADTPHSLIRKMMDNLNCWLCHQLLVWEFGLGKTPHLHHNHQTGEPLGFTCARCNPNALESEVIRQRMEIAQLRAQLSQECLDS
jgi:hypothetical protein